MYARRFLTNELNIILSKQNFANFLLLLPAKYNTFKILSSVLDKALTKTSRRQKLTVKAPRKRLVLKFRFRTPKLRDLCKSLTSNFKLPTQDFVQKFFFSGH